MSDVTSPVCRRMVMVDRVRRIVRDRLSSALAMVQTPVDISGLLPGKMLRTRLASYLLEAGGDGPAGVEQGCAAVEMVHSASLCHDDVIDGALVRRSAPALWRTTGASSAVLIGDVLLCEAIELAARMDGSPVLAAFLSAVRETCAAEAEHELLLRGKCLDQATSLRLARGKTGALFGFAAMLCASPDDPPARAALRECGYRIGTAYQLADDLLDRVGRQPTAGKTLGTDAARHKWTLAAGDPSVVATVVGQACEAAIEVLQPWPELRAGAQAFVEVELRPLWRRQGLSLGQFTPKGGPVVR